MCRYERKKIAVFTGDASKLASKFWPGPLTLILKKKKSNVCPNVTANLKTIAIRFPDSKIFFDIITKIKKPIAAPSANRSGFVSATRTSHVKQYFKHKIDLIIDSGQSKFGLESTVINLSSSPYRILRPGVIQKATIQKILNKRVYDHDLRNKIIISPGQFTKHYSTNTPIRMNAKKQLKGEAFLSFGKNKSIRHDNLNLSTKGNLEEAAHNLFDYLIQLDKLNKTTIAVSPIPNEGLGKVINDKLKRACRYG